MKIEGVFQVTTIFQHLLKKIKQTTKKILNCAEQALK